MSLSSSSSTCLSDTTGQAADALKASAAQYVTLLENLEKSFENRLHYLQVKRPQIKFLVHPLQCWIRVWKPYVTDEAASQKIELSQNDKLKTVWRDRTCWHSREISKCETGCSVTTITVYLIVSFFSIMKQVKTKCWSALTEKEWLQMATAE